MRKLSLFVCLLMLGAAFTAKAQGIEFIHDKKFQEILDMAKAQDKLVFMDCFTTWCGPCKRLAATVFPDSAVGEFYNSTFINTKFDMEKDEGVFLAGKYAIRAYPTLLWLDGDGNVKHKIVGGLDAAGLIQNGQKAIDPTPGILTGMKKQYADGKRDVDFLCDYVGTLNTSGEKYDAVFKEYLDKLTTKELTDPKHTRTIFNLTKDIKSPGLAFLMKDHNYYLNLVGATSFNQKINMIATKAVTEAPRADDKAMYDGAIELLKANKAPDAAEQVLRLSMQYYEHMNDWVNYDKNASAYVKKYAAKKPAVLNDVAWTYFLNVNDEAQLKKATKWAYTCINTDNKYTYNLTYAYLLYKQNIYKEAERACDYAIIRAKEEGVNPSSATALKEAIKKSLDKLKAKEAEAAKQ
ncbi:MAG TPA: thioredoxin domain-containing protein [Chitinophagales bacterium]|nr:thioredoxin domain-containing protein [Chitinophagales bacterium]